MRLLGLLVPLLLLPRAPLRADEGGLRPLHAEGTNLVDDQGRTVVLHGVNFGNWLVLEHYFYGTSFPDERSLWALMQSRFGTAGMTSVKEAHRSAWITPADFARVRALGLNAVRVPFWSDVLETDADPGNYSAEGWKWLDRAVDWCEAAGVYCVLDFHGLPGGQSDADHTGAAGRDQYWSSPQDHKRAADIWRAVAARYRGRAAVAAFDLMNEPMGAPSDDALLSAYGELLAAVRSADPERLVIVEDGYRGLQIFPSPAAQNWSGVIFSQHHYATFGDPDPTPEKVESYIAKNFAATAAQEKRLDAPVFVGEWNVMDKSAGGTAMTRRYIDEMGSRGWSWAIWTYKQTNAGGVSPDIFWSFYRNARPLELPDFQTDTLPEILRKIRGVRTENLTLFAPLRDGVADPNAAAFARARPRLDALGARVSELTARSAACFSPVLRP
jgi:hypothetical protein